MLCAYNKPSSVIRVNFLSYAALDSKQFNSYRLTHRNSLNPNGKQSIRVKFQ